MPKKRSRSPIPAKSLALPILFILILAPHAQANHGPGASGGGSATISGETLKQNHFELSVREDFTQFEAFNTAQAVARAQKGGDFDALNHGFITTADVAYGISDDFQIGASIGYFSGNDFISADTQPDGSVEVSKTNPDGLTDLALLGKYRVLSGQPGNLAVVGGVILPTGRSDVALANGEPLSPTDQPGTGRWGAPIGLGYSRFITSQLTVDASALYTFRFEKDSFKVGDRLDLGLALAWRITESIKTFPQYSLFAELNDVYLQKDRDHGDNDPNSGSSTLYATPGVRVRFDPHAALTAAPSFPIWQEVNGDQGKVDFKFALTFSLSF
jgi:hypothetical protein